MGWINNQWVIGIGTSVISGFLVFLFTKRFFTDKQKREYDQKVKTTNNEILYAIRPFIVEKTKPNNQRSKNNISKHPAEGIKKSYKQCVFTIVYLFASISYSSYVCC